MGGRGSLGKGAGTERGSRPQATGRPHTPGGQATASLRPELQMGFASAHTQHLHNEHQEQEVPGPFKKITNGKKVLVSRAQCRCQGTVTITMRCTHSREDLFSLKPIQEVEISPCSYTP